MNYDWREALAALVKRQDRLEDSELAEISKRASETGSPSSLGIVGVPGRSEIETRADGMTGWSDAEEAARGLSEALGRRDHLRNVASRTLADGSNSFQGVVTGILYASKEPLGDEFTLTVYFDSRTGSRLGESLYGRAGSGAMDDVPFTPMTLILEPRTT